LDFVSGKVSHADFTNPFMATVVGKTWTIVLNVAKISQPCGKKIGVDVALPRSPEQDANFVDPNYAIPAQIIGGKRKVTVRFQATDGNEIRDVFGMRTVGG
jgi:hypothetical protein